MSGVPRVFGYARGVYRIPGKPHRSNTLRGFISTWCGCSPVFAQNRPMGGGRDPPKPNFGLIERHRVSLRPRLSETEQGCRNILLETETSYASRRNRHFPSKSTDPITAPLKTSITYHHLKVLNTDGGTLKAFLLSGPPGVSVLGLASQIA